MSAFLRAIENIDDIDLDPRLRLIFPKAMLKFHDYFTKNNLMDAFDIDEYFDRLLFKSTKTNYPKYKFTFKKFSENVKFRQDLEKNLKKPAHKRKFEVLTLTDDYFGAMFSSKRLIRQNDLKPLVLRKQMKQDEVYDSYVKTFIHEFIHFLTLASRITYKDENGRRITTEYANVDSAKKRQEDFRNKNAYYALPAVYEPLTEIMATKIMGEGTPSYGHLICLMNVLLETFEIDFEKDFLRRNLNGMAAAISKEYLSYFKDDIGDIFRSGNDVKSCEYMAPTEFISDMLADMTILKVNNGMSAKEFAEQQARFYHSLMYSHSIEIKDHHESLVNNLNATYIYHLFEKHGIEYTSERFLKFRGMLNKAVGFADAEIYAKEHDADYAVRFKFTRSGVFPYVKKYDEEQAFIEQELKEQGKSIDDLKMKQEYYPAYVFIVKNGKLMINNKALDKIDLTRTTLIFNQHDKFKDCSFDEILFSDVNPLRAYKEKGDDHFIINSKDHLKKGGISKEKKSPLKVTFKNNKLTLSGKSETKTFNKNTAKDYLNNIDAMVNDEIAKVKQEIEIQKQVKERGLTLIK